MYEPEEQDKMGDAKIKVEGFSPFVAFCFTINYILGTGFLTIPWAYIQGGLLLSSVVTLLVGVFSDMAKNYLLETMARAEVMLDDRLHWAKNSSYAQDDSERQLLFPVDDQGSERMTATPANYEAIDSKTIINTDGCLLTPENKSNLFLVNDRKFEVNTLCRVFLGNTGHVVYTTVVCLYIYCALWAFTSVFASAMAEAAPLPARFLGDYDDDYLIYAILFALVVVPLTCMDLQEQVVIQVLLTAARFLLLALMLATSPYCSSVVDGAADDNELTAPSALIRFSGISKMLPIMVFAHIFQHGVPDLSQPVADKTHLSPIFRSACMFTSLSYVTIGLTIGYAFQGTSTGVKQSANLNWDACKRMDDNLAMQVISYYIVCFPALDVISAFPLNAITLGNNMFGAAYGENLYKVENNRWIRTRFRLLASIPPIVFAILERELGKITDYAGTTGFVMGYSFPALLYIRSRAMAKEKGYPIHTYYSSYASAYPIAIFVFLFGLAMVIYVLYCLIAATTKEV